MVEVMRTGEMAYTENCRQRLHSLENRNGPFQTLPGWFWPRESAAPHKYWHCWWSNTKEKQKAPYQSTNDDSWYLCPLCVHSTSNAWMVGFHDLLDFNVLTSDSEKLLHSHCKGSVSHLHTTESNENDNKLFQIFLKVTCNSSVKHRTHLNTACPYDLAMKTIIWTWNIYIRLNMWCIPIHFKPCS